MEASLQAMLAALLGSLVVKGTAATAVLTPRAVRFIGVGYDIIDGNPEGGGVNKVGGDPGLLLDKRFLGFTFDDASENECDGDQAADVPDQCEMFLMSGEPIRTGETIFGDATTYRSKLLTHVQQSSGPLRETFAAVAFSGSNRFKHVRVRTSSFGDVFQTVETIRNLAVVRYKTELAGKLDYPLTDGFIADACSLPLGYNETIYMQFLQKWGTHVVTGALVGVRTGQLFVSTRTDFVNFAKQTVEKSVQYKESISGNQHDLEIDIALVHHGLPDGTTIGNSSTSYAVGTNQFPEPVSMELTEISEFFAAAYWTQCSSHADRGLCDYSFGARRGNIKGNVKRALAGYAAWRNVVPLNATPVAVPVAVMWPVGTYALPKPRSGCPNSQFRWSEGYRLQDLEDSTATTALSPSHHFYRDKSGNNLFSDFCVKTTRRVDFYEPVWPRGSYCIAKFGECPEGFGTGSVYWDDEDSNNDNTAVGIYPDGVYDANTKMYYCCREDAPPENAITLPVDSPFFLYKRFATCQQVRGMSVTAEFIEWDTENNANDDAVVDPHPFPGLIADGALRLEYCYYEPL